ncbi:MAG: phosphoribosylformylglycinamidine cyclo-ligase [Chloroflexi bacterium]|nr:phosphoribosylformylglycinamidine cyclo-ligase [Chloroflexota bacterium]MDA1146955.1 phosphoribosylformylglycinamidine cyclo-ligase [Chloroflexota bacterium]
MTDSPQTTPLRYVDAGVDVDAADATVRQFAAIARRTMRPEVLSGVGLFAGLFRVPEGYRDPVLVASADGVGTKLLIAAALERFDTIGADLVNHCVNDILTTGARPLFFLDYLATADLSQERRVELVGGIGEACRAQNVALLGGETADMPDVYRSGDFDLAGFIVGIVERDQAIESSRLTVGDVLVALPSGGLQTNGYSLVREIWAIGKGLGADHDRAALETTYEELGGTLGDALLAIHPSFVTELEPHLGALHGIAHITGGGIPGNLSRLFTGPAEHLGARIDASSWEIPAIFQLIQRTGGIEDGEMYRAFNMGAGIIVAMDQAAASSLIADQPQAWRIGEIVQRAPGAPPVAGLPA